MKKKVLCLLLLCRILHSQNQAALYYSYINTAEHYYLYGKNLRADSCFKAAFDLDSVRGFNQDYLTAAVNALQIKDTCLFKNYLLHFSKRGGDYKMLRGNFASNIFLKENSKQIRLLLNQDKSKTLRNQLNLNLKDYKKILNKNAITEIRRLYRSDQRARSWFTSILPKRMRSGIMNTADKKNAKKLLSICEKYGWPGFNVIGEFRPNGKYSNEGIDVIIRHFSKEDLEKIEPFYIDAIKNVNAYPYAWASCMDYCFIKNPYYIDSTKVEFKQKYGTNSSNNIIIPFGSLSEINKHRQELFLGDINDYCKIRGWAMPKEEKVIITRNKN